MWEEPTLIYTRKPQWILVVLFEGRCIKNWRHPNIYFYQFYIFLEQPKFRIMLGCYWFQRLALIYWTIFSTNVNVSTGIYPIQTFCMIELIIGSSLLTAWRNRPPKRQMFSSYDREYVKRYICHFKKCSMCSTLLRIFCSCHTIKSSGSTWKVLFKLFENSAKYHFIQGVS